MSSFYVIIYTEIATLFLILFQQLNHIMSISYKNSLKILKW